MEKVIAFLQRLHPLSSALKEELSQAARFIRMRKNEFLQHENSVSHHVWFLQKGLVRCYYEHNAQEVTVWFMEEGNIVVLLKSITDQIKSIFHLQALEDCELYVIHHRDIKSLYKKYPEARSLHYVVLEQYSALKDFKIRATNGRPEQRYRYFEKHFPHLLNRLKLEHIASYLNMDVRTLTRARKKH